MNINDEYRAFAYDYMDGKMEDENIVSILEDDFRQLNIDNESMAQMQLFQFKQSPLENENQASILHGEGNIQLEIDYGNFSNQHFVTVTKNEESFQQNDLISVQNLLNQEFEDQIKPVQNYNCSVQIQKKDCINIQKIKFQETKHATGNKSFQIMERTKRYQLIIDLIYNFMSMFVDINFPEGKNIFVRFNLFKQQLVKQHFNQFQCCFYKNYLVEISLTITKYHLISQEFQLEENNTNQATPVHFLKDILIILEKCYNEYSDLLRIVVCFMRGQAIQNTNQDLKRWQNFAKFFKKQHFINKSFYKSHNCNYRNFIIQDKQRRNDMDEEWFYMRENQIRNGLKIIQQSKAGKKNFLYLMQRDQEKYQQGINSNIGYFTLIVLFDQVKKNEKANSLIYADDIFNVIIKYNIIL